MKGKYVKGFQSLWKRNPVRTKEPFKKKKLDYSSFIFAGEEGFYCIEPIYISRSVH